jgi:HEPN domain-containing protein
MPRAKRASVDRRHARAYLDKAEQFLRAADRAAAGSDHDAAMLNAIHAAISASDAVVVSLAGVRSTDPDHQRAVDLLEEVAGTSREIRAEANQLRRLLARKHLVEYESRRAKPSESAEALRRASRFVAWARSVVLADRR